MNGSKAKPEPGWAGPRRGLERAPTGVGRRVVASAAHREHGRVARLFVDGGFGFVRTAAGAMAYFTAEDVVDGRFLGLEVGAKVEFDLGGDGLPHARQVERVS